MNLNWWQLVGNLEMTGFLVFWALVFVAFFAVVIKIWRKKKITRR